MLLQKDDHDSRQSGLTLRIDAIDLSKGGQPQATLTHNNFCRGLPPGDYVLGIFWYDKQLGY